MNNFRTCEFHTTVVIFHETLPIGFQNAEQDKRKEELLVVSQRAIFHLEYTAI